MSKRYKQQSRPPYKKASSGIKATASKQDSGRKIHPQAVQLNNHAALVGNTPHSSLFWRKFIKFGGLSGLGWLGDFCILLSLVGILGLPPGRANVISSCIAAMMVFMVSREKIFAKAEGRGVLRLLSYFGYTILVIAIASAAVHYLVPELVRLAGHYCAHPAFTTVTAVAKILVTPPTLILNFLMSGLLSETKLTKRGIHG
jgi:putative flippase GtrA